MSPTRSERSGLLKRLVKAEFGTILFTLLALGFFVGAFGLRGRAGYFPMGVATATVLLGVVSILLSVQALRSPNPGQKFVADRDASGEDVLRWDAQTLKAILWFVLALVTTYVFGILVGAGVSTLVYFHFVARSRPLLSVLNGAVTVMFIWVVFGWLGGLPLYEGLL